MTVKATVGKNNTLFIRVECDVTIDIPYEGASYRLWVTGRDFEDQLIAERTWRYSQHEYIRENLQLNLAPGDYRVVVRPVKPTKAKFKLSNHKAKLGACTFINNTDILRVGTT